LNEEARKSSARATTLLFGAAKNNPRHFCSFQYHNLGELPELPFLDTGNNFDRTAESEGFPVGVSVAR